MRISDWSSDVCSSDLLMRNAREQAEQYARALPAEHIWPPFILVCDVGHAFEVFADFSGQRRNYRPLPDPRGFPIYLEHLSHQHLRERLPAVCPAQLGSTTFREAL